MNIERIIQLIDLKFKTILLVGILIGSLAFAFLMISQKNYQSQIDLLITQNQNGFSDYYALSKSADYLSSVLVESVYSERFIDEVQNTGQITSGFLPQNKTDKLKTWEKTIDVRKTSNVGIINIKVYSNSQKESSEISGAVVDVLTNKYYLFLGKGQDLDVRILSGPIIEKNPSFSQVAIIFVGGSIIGMILTLLTIIWRDIKGKYQPKIAFNKSSHQSFTLENPNKESVDYWADKL